MAIRRLKSGRWSNGSGKTYSTKKAALLAQRRSKASKAANRNRKASNRRRKKRYRK
jgi:hypothetical protein